VDALWSVRKLLPNPDVYPLSDNVAAVSVGIVDGHCVLDLDYELDFAAAVDMNVVMTGSGQFIEIQGTGEEATFSDDELTSLLKLAKRGIKSISKQQAKTLGRIWPFSKS
jgi:ribonuclease PH